MFTDASMLIYEAKYHNDDYNYCDDETHFTLWTQKGDLNSENSRGQVILRQGVKEFYYFCDDGDENDCELILILWEENYFTQIDCPN